MGCYKVSVFGSPQPIAIYLIAGVAASLLHYFGSRRLSCWWWNSHLCLNNSKCLEDNLIAAEGLVPEVNPDNRSGEKTEAKHAGNGTVSLYQPGAKKLPSLGNEFTCALTVSRRFKEPSQPQLFILKLVAERDNALKKNQDFLERMTRLEVVLFEAQKDAKEYEERVLKVEDEAQFLRNKISAFESEANVERAYHELHEAHCQTVEENRTLLKTLSNLKEENSILEEEKNTIILERFTSDNLSAIYKRYMTESAAEVKVLTEDLNKLHGVNHELVSEVADNQITKREMEERRNREANRTLELLENSKWLQQHLTDMDAKVESLFVDSQVSVIRELLFEDKVHELTGVCKSLQDETASKAQVIEQLRETIISKESEIAVLKNQLLEYGPAIVSPSDYKESLHHSLLSSASLVVVGNDINKDVEVEAHVHENNFDDLADDQHSHMPHELVDLQMLQSRNKADENVVGEETNKPENSNPSIEQEDATRDIEYLEFENAAVLDKSKQGGEGGVEDARTIIHHGKRSSSVKNMDAEVKEIIKLIEEDSDSFARRAEMFYKKRPELMKLLEEFFREYHAFAKSSDHATGEIQQAHRTMTDASPNHVPFVLSDDLLSGYPQGTAHKMPHLGSAPFGSNKLHKDVMEISTSGIQSDKVGSFIGDFDAVINKGGLKQIYKIFGSRELAEGILRKGLNPDKGSEEKIEYEQIVVHHMLEDITNLKHFLSQCSDNMLQLVVENSILLTLLGQLKSEGLEVVSQKSNLDNVCKMMSELFFFVQSEKDELCEKNSQLRSQAEKDENRYLRKAMKAEKEAHNLVKQIKRKDKELSEKQEEWEKLNFFVQDERLRNAREIQTLKDMFSQSVEEQSNLELQLKEMKNCNVGLEKHIQQIINENQRMKKRIEDEVAVTRILNSNNQTLVKSNLALELKEMKNCNVGLEKHIQQIINENQRLKKRIEDEVAVTRTLVKKHWNEKYYLGANLGEGNYGVVRECHDRLSGKKIACKSIPISMEHIVKVEIDIMCQLSPHQNVVKLVEVYRLENHINLLMELCLGGDLFGQLNNNGRYSEDDARIIFQQLIEAVKHCHDKGVIHRDLKPQNILLATRDSTSQIKLTDFGLATYIQPGQKLHDSVGTPLYAAPEVLLANYDEKADIWSCGIILYMLLFGRAPTWGPSNAQFFDAILAADLQFSSDPKVSGWAITLIEGMLHPDPSSRLTAKQVSLHPWLKPPPRFPANPQIRKI